MYWLSSPARRQDSTSPAAQKCQLDPEELNFRLRSFPLELLDTLPVTSQDFLTAIKERYHELTKTLLG